jgi:hypothetical protein
VPRRARLQLLLAACLVLAPRAYALTIVVAGAGGTPGVGVDGGPGVPADAVAVTGDTENTARATGGQGGAATNANGGDGGAASAIAETSVGSPATASATANGGRGGNATGGGLVAAGDGGDATAEAHATGTGGSRARTIVTGGAGGTASGGALEGGAGGEAILDGAVSGSDPTALVLDQIASGGGGGQGFIGGVGGDATSLGDFANAAGGDLAVRLVATAGTGGSGDTPGAGGTARVGGSATSSGAGDATLEATARGTTLVLDPLLAHATGTGDASASLDAELLGAAAGLSLTNRVDAVTDGGGALQLRQRVEASGAAESHLDVTRSASLVELEAIAESRTLGSAAISVRGANDSGGVRLAGEARGGRAHEASAPMDAVAAFQATTSGDGHDIEIGSPSRRAGAHGSEWSEGRGGDATVDADAVALGNSAVTIDVVAEGGEADWSEPGGYGGSASTSARGQGAGERLVTVRASALGGGGGYDFKGPGGDAHAQAEAIGLGVASAHATARAGYPGGWRERLIGGGASAFARATGSVAQAHAIASSSLPFDGEHDRDWEIARILVEANASLPGGASVGASTDLTRFADAGVDPASDVFVRAAFAPESALLDEALAGNPLAQATLPPSRPKLPIALVEIQARSGNGASQTLETNIVLNGSFRGFYDEVKAVQLSFLDPELDASALSSLTVRSWDTRNPDDIYEVAFTSALEALAFLDDGRLFFGGAPTERHLELVLETTGAEGDFFIDLVVTAVPEPPITTLLALSVLSALAAGASRVSRRGRHLPRLTAT